jgi:23S rRNA maturation-related 3'-5' exoribonuclease YhaM
MERAAMNEKKRIKKLCRELGLTERYQIAMALIILEEHGYDYAVEFVQGLAERTIAND